jgi:hypothetical protein
LQTTCLEQPPNRERLMSNLILVLLIASTALIGMLAGASLDQSFKQLPARHRLGSVAFSRYSRAADLTNGIAFYAALGIGALLVSLASAVAVRLAGISSMAANPIYLATTLSVLHTLTTARAAPLNFSQKKVPEEDERMLRSIQNKFTMWQSIRCVLQVANFGVNLWAMVAYIKLT